MNAKRMSTLVGGIAFVLTTAGCAQENEHPVIQGTYVSPSGDESISISGTQIRFHIKMNANVPPAILDRTYKDYWVWPDGQLFVGPTSSNDVVMGIGKFDWRWDGEKITQKDPKSDEPLKFFTRKP